MENPISKVLNTSYSFCRLGDHDKETLLEIITAGVPNQNQSNDGLVEYIIRTCHTANSRNLKFEHVGKDLYIEKYHKNGNFFTNIFSGKLENSLSSKFIECVLLLGKEYIAALVQLYFKCIYNFDLLGLKTIEKYLFITKQTRESLPELFLRVAIAVICPAQSTFYEDRKKIQELYAIMMKKNYIHASPTLFNSGLRRGQLASCFLSTVSTDSLHGILDSYKRVGLISGSGGGIGIAVSNIRSAGSKIIGANGISKGLIPSLRLLNETAKYCDQSGKRKGAFAVYLEPHHPEIFEFLQLKKPNGLDNQRTRDLNLGLWISDLFMDRVRTRGKWHLFSSSECPGLDDVYGERYKSLYEYYEHKGYGTEVQATDVWHAILTAQIETSQPYILFKDTANIKSNQNNLGIIKCANLCTEIIQFSSEHETAVCNLATISLPSCIKYRDVDRIVFDFDTFRVLIEIGVECLNRVIDNSIYPDGTTYYSNMKNRPIGLGVQGFDTMLKMLNLPYMSTESKKLHFEIFENLYYYSLNTSMKLAKTNGPYRSFEGSYLSRGVFHHEHWPRDKYETRLTLDWESLRMDVMRHGIYNSLLTMVAPTATTSLILGNSESIEPLTSLICERITKDGNNVSVCPILFERLNSMGVWDKCYESIINHDGSIQHLEFLDQHIRDVFKLAFELDQIEYNEMATDRALFLDNSQSKSMFFKEMDKKFMSRLWFQSWIEGQKSAVYYCRQKPVGVGYNVNTKICTINSNTFDGTDCVDCEA